MLSPCFQLQLKLQTSSMFKGKKENYPFSVCRPFLDTRIGESVSKILHLTIVFNCIIMLYTYNMIRE